VVCDLLDMVRKNKLKYQVLKQHDEDLAQKGKKKQQRLGADNRRRAAVKAGRFKEQDDDENFRRKIEGAFVRLSSQQPRVWTTIMY
jgi:hypothetical protein